MKKPNSLIICKALCLVMISYIIISLISRNSLRALYWKKLVADRPLMAITATPAIWPQRCLVNSHTPTGIVFMRTTNQTAMFRSHLRQKWRFVEDSCGYKLLFTMDAWVGNLTLIDTAIVREVHEFDDILIFSCTSDTKLCLPPSSLEAIRIWANAVCAEEMINAVVVDNLSDDTFADLHASLKVYSLRPGTGTVDTVAPPKLTPLTADGRHAHPLRAYHSNELTSDSLVVLTRSLRSFGA